MCPDLKAKYIMKLLSNKGAILGVLLIYVIILTIWGYAFIQQAYLNGSLTDSNVRSQEAFWLAEAGTRRATGRIMKDPKYSANPANYPMHNVTLGAGTYSVDATSLINGGSITYTITSTGTVGNKTRTIQTTWANKPLPIPAVAAEYAANFAFYVSPGTVTITSHDAGGISHHNGSIFTNGDIATAGSFNVDGDVHIGASYTDFLTSPTTKITITGSVTHDVTNLFLPSVTLPDTTGWQQLPSVTTLNPGQYICSGQGLPPNMTPPVTIVFQGYVTLGGTINVANNGSPVIFYLTNTTQINGLNILFGSDPSQLQIYGTDNCTDIGCAGSISAVIYAPKAELSLPLSGSVALRGSFVGRYLNGFSSFTLDYYEPLANMTLQAGPRLLLRNSWQEN